MSYLPYTSQEVNKSWGKHRNKFFKGCWEVRVNGYCAGKKIVMHSLAVKSHQDGFKCPHCGSTKPATDSYDRTFEVTLPKYDKVTGERTPGKEVTIKEKELECADCHKWWRIWSGVGFNSNVVYYDTEENW